MTGKKKSTEYTKEFRDSAVRLCKQPGRSVASVSGELKIPAWKLSGWLRESRDKQERLSEVDELIKLQNELKRAKEEIEILKKAAAYFAKNLP
jgi:transposase